jgi:hypothetical protein
MGISHYVNAAHLGPFQGEAASKKVRVHLPERKKKLPNKILDQDSIHDREPTKSVYFIVAVRGKSINGGAHIVLRLVRVDHSGGSVPLKEFSPNNLQHNSRSDRVAW